MSDTPQPPVLDVLVPFWGDPALLYRTVESVRAQTESRWRLIVIDDCYPGGDVARHFADESDTRIRYVRNEVNLGITDNYRRCLEFADAPLMMFLGCDDLMHPNFLATVLAAHEVAPEAAVIQPGVEVIDEHDRVVLPLGDRVKRVLAPSAARTRVLEGEELAASLLGGNWLYWPSLVFRTDAIKARTFRDGLPIIQDLALVIDMVAAGERLLFVPEVCFSYRRHAGSASGASLVEGRRLTDERHYYHLVADQMRTLGWRRAARAAERRWTSRLHGLTLLPRAASTSRQAVRNVLAHAFAF